MSLERLASRQEIYNEGRKSNRNLHITLTDVTDVPKSPSGANPEVFMSAARYYGDNFYARDETGLSGGHSQSPKSGRRDLIERHPSLNAGIGIGLLT